MFRVPFHERFFECNSNSMEISFCSQPSCGQAIIMEFWTWYDSCAVVVRINFLAIWYTTMGNTEFDLLSNLNYDGKIVPEMGPW